MSIFGKLQEGVLATSAEEMRELAGSFAAALPQDCTLAMHGNLGVGKTTFVQGLARGFGIQEAVTSPTFNIFTLHRSALRNLVHLDAYRLERPEQIEDLMLEDFLTTPYCLAIEWPERIEEWIPRDAYHLYLSIEGPGRHRVQLKGPQ